MNAPTLAAIVLVATALSPLAAASPTLDGLRPQGPRHGALAAQEVFEGEVRQLVTFRFVPGGSTEARTIFRERALPLYELDPAMRYFRAFREVESAIPLDLVVVSSFEGMAGMDEHNTLVSALPGPDGQGIGGFYGAIGGLIVTHDDQFVEMLPALSRGDPSTRRRVALVWYRLLPGQERRFEETLARELVPWEQANDIPAATGRFLLSDGWTYLRILGLESLGAYQSYWMDGRGHGELAGITSRRREVIVAPVPELFVR